jgi:hypothetical protein
MIAELFHTDIQMNGQMDMTKLTVAFHNFNFANTPKNWNIKEVKVLKYK